MRDGIDEFTLLCEDCGYVIEGLPREGKCPECGKPVAKSLPERRAGTAWQQSPSLHNYIATVAQCIRHPRKTLDSVRIERASALRFRHRSIGLAAILVSVPTTLAVASMAIRNESHESLLWSPVLLVCIALTTAIILFFLTWLESRGLRLIGRTRRMRIDRAIADTVTSFGTVGWVLSAAGPAASISLAGLVVLFDMQMIDHGEPGSAFHYQSPGFSDLGWLLLNIASIGTIAIPVVGFLFFEIFAYLGLRRCKFANRSRPELRQEETENEERRAGSPSH